MMKNEGFTDLPETVFQLTSISLAPFKVGNEGGGEEPGQ